MDIQGEILSAIDIMVKKYIETQIPSLKSGVVTSVSGNKCNVLINGANYVLTNSTNCIVRNGTPVWVFVPNGSVNMNNAFVLGIK